MSAVKQTLIKQIKRMSEKEARRMLDLVQQGEKGSEEDAIIKKLAEDPTFVVPKRRSGGFRKVRPAKGKGIPASQMIIRDRR